MQNMGNLLLKIYCDKRTQKTLFFCAQMYHFALFKAHSHSHHPSAQSTINKTVFFRRYTLSCLCDGELFQLDI